MGEELMESLMEFKDRNPERATRFDTKDMFVGLICCMTRKKDCCQSSVMKQ